MPASVTIREVGLRDGLQSLNQALPFKNKIAWIRDEFAAGISEMEVTSLVPPALLPQLADGPEVIQCAVGIDGLVVAALVPNLKGAERAMELGVHKMNFVLSASESHNQANVRRSTEESLADFQRIAQRLRENGGGALLCGGISTAMGCTIEGRVDESRVVDIAVRLADAGADELIIADTVGYAGPAQVSHLFDLLNRVLPDMPLAAHFHDTRGLGLANATAALNAGVGALDASLGGLGGCPYAPGATGNIVTEDLVFLCERMGFETGVDVDKLLQVRLQIERQLPGAPFSGSLARAGLPLDYQQMAEAVG